GDLDHRAVGQKTRVQRHKRLPPLVFMVEMGPQLTAVGGEPLRQRPHLAPRRRGGRRQARSKVAVDEYQPARLRSPVHPGQIQCPHPPHQFRRRKRRLRLEHTAGDRGHVSLPPPLVAVAGKAHVGEARERLLPQFMQPRRPRILPRKARHVAGKYARGGVLETEQRHGYAPRRPAAPASTRSGSPSQPYPLSSSSSASSLPPDFTIRPPDSTCT